MSETDKHTRNQLRIIAEKALLGDGEAKKLHEEGRAALAKVSSKMAARNLGLCGCTRTDGIVCGARLFSEPAKKLHRCYRCWVSEKDDRPCDHTFGKKEIVTRKGL